jgi:hypothetical protein
MSSDNTSTPTSTNPMVIMTDGTRQFQFYDQNAFSAFLDYLPKNNSSKETSLPQPLLQPLTICPSPFFQKLLDEINKAYYGQLYTSTWVCLRKLFENFLVELLRKKYTTLRIDMYYDINQSRFKDFSILIENLEQNVQDFNNITQGFDQAFFDFLKKFKDQANRNAHSIDIIEDFQKINNLTNLNQYCVFLCDVIRKIP